MIITKHFTYFDQEHIVSVHTSIQGVTIELDGVLCNEVKDLSNKSNLRHLEATVELEGDRLTICVLRKEIFVFKDDVDIETGVRKHPKRHLHWVWKALSKLMSIPFLILVYLVYSDSVFNIHRVSDSTWMTAKLCLVMVGMLVLFSNGVNRCRYYEQHPLVPIGQKRMGIILWTLLTIAMSTLLLLIANYWILR